MKTMLKKFSRLKRLLKGEAWYFAYPEQTVELSGRTYTVRMVTPDDIKELLRIEREVYAGEMPWTRSAFLSEITSSAPHLYILIEQNDKVIGFIGCRVTRLDGHVTNVAVSLEEQGRGIGGFLLNEAIQFSKNYGCETVSLEVRLSNKHAQGVYRKFGFVSQTIRASYYDDNQEDALEMILDLKEE